MLVSLVRQWVLALNPNAMTDSQTLLQQAACHGCNASNPYELQLMLVALMIQVVNTGGGGGGGSGQTMYYVGPDANSAGIVPANTSLAAIAYSKDGSGPTMGWNPTTQLWT